MKISYLDQKNHESEREILPLSLVYNEDCVTVLSWCCLREDFRMFRTDRITALRSTDRSFRPRRVALLRTYLEQLQGQLNGQMAGKSDAL